MRRAPAVERPRRVTRDPGQQLHPAWSADGRRIAFAEQHRSGNWVIYSIDADGSGRRQVTDERDSSQDPSWSPDGNRIAFVAQTEGQESVAVIDADGTGRRSPDRPDARRHGAVVVARRSKNRVRGEARRGRLRALKTRGLWANNSDGRRCEAWKASAAPPRFRRPPAATTEDASSVEPGSGLLWSSLADGFRDQMHRSAIEPARDRHCGSDSGGPRSYGRARGGPGHLRRRRHRLRARRSRDHAPSAARCRPRTSS